MASSSTGLDPLRAHRQPNRTASPVKPTCKRSSASLPCPLGVFGALTRGQKGASFYLYFGIARPQPQTEFDYA